MNTVGLVFVFCGCFSIAGAIFNWDWFMNNRKARSVVKMFGRTGTRIFYGLLGIILSGFGVCVTLGIINISK